MQIRKKIHIMLPDGRLRRMVDIEYEIIRHAVQNTKNWTQAAQQLGIGRSTFYRKCNEYAIPINGRRKQSH